MLYYYSVVIYIMLYYSRYTLYTETAKRPYRCITTAHKKKTPCRYEYCGYPLRVVLVLK